MAEEPNQIKRHIDSTREELGDNLHELEHRVKQATNWRTYVEKSPMTMVAAAFAGGVVASVLVGGPRNSDSHRNGGPARERTAEPERRHGTQYQKNRVADMWDTLKGTLVGMAAAQVKTFLNEAIPGFRQHYEAVERQEAGG
jgi:hypothetical protein